MPLSMHSGRTSARWHHTGVVDKIGPGNYQLVVQDNGVGLPEDVDLRRQGSMGANIMRRLTKQLDGLLQIENSGGVRISISFPLIKHQPHYGHDN
ncbi:hypothetical protein [Spirosoma telluris]|uniref:hypothetical protein n=1 Tax=Spirosoma telluris TaxID=2183553 RepID=UPI001314E633